MGCLEAQKMTYPSYTEHNLIRIITLFRRLSGARRLNHLSITTLPCAPATSLSTKVQVTMRISHTGHLLTIFDESLTSKMPVLDSF
jgi:hypothetical protein